jgi:hypothetical protein
MRQKGRLPGEEDLKRNSFKEIFLPVTYFQELIAEIRKGQQEFEIIFRR